MNVSSVTPETTLAQDANQTQKSINQPEQKTPLELALENGEEERNLNKQSVGVEAFKQSLESDPTAQFVSLLV